MNLKILELEWLVKHKELLDEEELQRLDDLKLFEQYQNGEIHLGAHQFLGLLNDLQELYEKYSGKTFGEEGDS